MKGNPEIWIHALGAKSGGGLTYLFAILPELISQLQGRGIRVVLLLPKPLSGFDLPDWIQVKAMPYAASNAVSRLFFDQIILPAWLKSQPGAILYCSGSHSPIIKSVPTVALLRNAIYFDQEFLGRVNLTHKLSLKLQGTLIALGARGCRSIHYPSRSMRELVELYYPNLKEAGQVNSYGVGNLFTRSETQIDTSSPAEQHVPSFLYVMNYTLQKNLTLVLEALALARQQGIKVKVIVTSSLSDGPNECFAVDRSIIEKHDLIGSGYLVAAGPTVGDALVDLYRSVDACVFPSICESFGHPLVESMAMNKPLICADRPYAREICGEHAIYIDPKNPQELLKVWKTWPHSLGTASPPEREELIATFSWRTHVASLIDALVGAPSSKEVEVEKCVA
jgi:glycosyltransferase involved in cell wall biosynthesis